MIIDVLPAGPRRLLCGSRPIQSVAARALSHGTLGLMRRDDSDEEVFALDVPASRTGTRRAPAGWLDLGITVTLFGLSVPLLIVGWFGVTLAMFAFDACSSRACNDAAGSITFIGYPIAAVASTTLCAFFADRRRRARRRAWTLGVAALLSVVALFAVAATVIHFAVRPA